jgi:hypothetical protein
MENNSIVSLADDRFFHPLKELQNDVPQCSR